MTDHNVTRRNDPPDAEAAAQVVTLSDIPANLVWKAAGAIGAVLILSLLFIDLVHALMRPLAVLFAAIVLATALAPITDYLERWLPRSLAIAAIFLSLAILVVSLGVVLIQPLVQETRSFIDSVPGYLEEIQVWVTDVAEIELDNISIIEQVAGWVQPAVGYLVSVPLMVFGTGLEMFIFVFLTIYWLYTMPRLKAFFVSLFPPHRQEMVSAVLARMGTRMGGYVRGVIISGSIVAFVVYAGLTLFGVRYALLLALLSFVGEFVPNLGPIFAAVPAVIVAAVDSFGIAVAVIIFYIVIQQLESYVLTPWVMRGQVEIPPLATTFVVFAGFMVGGILWAILAIPLSGAILTLVTDVIAPAIRQKTGAQPPGDEGTLIGPELPK